MEIAIVPVIIGLIVGGIMVGGTMVRNAELQKLLRQKDGISAAIAAFRMKYGAYPGDFSTATNEWGTAPTCPNPCYNPLIITTGISTCNGTGDGVIGLTQAPGDPQYYQQLSEDALAWQHLSNASMIPGKYDGGSAEAAGAFSPRVSRPDSAVAGNSGWTLYWLGAQVGNWRFWDGNYGTALILARDFVPVSYNIDLHGIMSPKELSAMDRKVDDGSPMTGIVRSGPPGGWGGHCVSGTYASASYTTSGSWENSAMVCSPIFLLNL